MLAGENGLCKEVAAKLNAAPNLNARHAVMDATVLEMDENLLGPNLVKALSMESLGSKVKAAWTPAEENAFVAGLRQHNREYTDASVQWHLEHWKLKEARAAEEEAAAKQQQQQQLQLSRQQQGGRRVQRQQAAHQRWGKAEERRVHGQQAAQQRWGKSEERAAKREEEVTGEDDGVM
ncbi:hypothetical protein DUNSADRAFT_15443 [Dunaliella salina]|uniref:Uncharacterized protein n=1 Tax=Dunaliella salina TaxID=3046 RepID=A0ABQ7G5D9_DUNSA|nr:hypothetical protein DUNSADRAFT_15443 [Dunaliella salina]|eukprot:KAF5829825.1 hypothetical protein DUNSADRAFT_15443 [Dunaliella salina]